jgi:pimeloyl-ACP methyl ester carboxylesterase
MPRRMVLIHGAWLTSLSWELWIPYFESRGYEVSAPEWPRKDASVDELNADADGLAGLGVAEIVDHYAGIIGAMPEPPVIIGHSFGGLFTQLLLGKGLGAAGVALDPAPPRGVLRLTWSELKATSPVLAHPANRNGVATLTFEQFAFGFANTFSEEDAVAAYERYVVPETGRIFFEDGLANFSLHSPLTIDFGKSDRAPLLITGGGKDNQVPAAVTRADHHKYRRSEARTDYLEFPDAPHMLMIGSEWKAIAGRVADWLDDALSVSDPRD